MFSSLDVTSRPRGPRSRHTQFSPGRKPAGRLEADHPGDADRHASGRSPNAGRHFLLPARRLRDQLVSAELLVEGRIRDLLIVDVVDDDLKRVADRAVA